VTRKQGEEGAQAVCARLCTESLLSPKVTRKQGEEGAQAVCARLCTFFAEGDARRSLEELGASLEGAMKVTLKKV